MLYAITRPLATAALSMYFRKVHIMGLEHIPKDKPVILAANHPTAFLEPCILACWVPRPLYFLARGGLFSTKFYTMLLRSLHIIPIFRVEDAGWAGVKNNIETFDQCYQALSENKVINILAEGRTIHEKRLRPLMKGTARMAFGSLDYKDGDLDIHVIPVSVNYTDVDHFRSDVSIVCHAPLRVQAYKEAYKAHPAKTIREFLEDVATSLKKNMVLIDNKEDDRWVDRLLLMKGNEIPEKPFPVTTHKDRVLRIQQAITQHVNGLEKTDKDELQARLFKYEQALKKNALHDDGVVGYGYYNLRNGISLIIGCIPFGLGMALNYAPIGLARYIAKTKVRKFEFKASVRVAASIIGYLFYWLLGLGLAIGFQSWVLLSVVLLMPFWGYFAILYRDLWKKYYAERAFSLLSVSKQASITSMRRNILPDFIVEPKKIGVRD